MNRRSFLTGITASAAAFIIPELITSERRVFALDRTMMHAPPPRVPGDDTAWVQWHIDHRVPVPTGRYFLRTGLIVPPRGAFIAHGSRFDVAPDVPCALNVLLAPPWLQGTVEVGGA